MCECDVSWEGGSRLARFRVSHAPCPLGHPDVASQGEWPRPGNASSVPGAIADPDRLSIRNILYLISGRRLLARCG